MKTESHLLIFTLAALIITVVFEISYDILPNLIKQYQLFPLLFFWLLFWLIWPFTIAFLIYFVFIKLYLIFFIFYKFSHKTETQNKSYKRIINEDDIYLASVLILSTFAIRKVSEVFSGLFKGQIWFYIAVFLAVFLIWFIVNLFYSWFIDLFQIHPYY